MKDQKDNFSLDDIATSNLFSGKIYIIMLIDSLGYNEMSNIRVDFTNNQARKSDQSNIFNFSPNKISRNDNRFSQMTVHNIDKIFGGNDEQMKQNKTTNAFFQAPRIESAKNADQLNPEIKIKIAKGDNKAKRLVRYKNSIRQSFDLLDSSNKIDFMESMGYKKSNFVPSTNINQDKETIPDSINQQLKSIMKQGSKFYKTKNAEKFTNVLSNSKTNRSNLEDNTVNIFNNLLDKH